MGKSGAVFNTEKLNWLNQQHLRLKLNSALADLVEPLLAGAGFGSIDRPYLERAVGLMKERVTTLRDFVDFGGYLFAEPSAFDDKGIQKHWSEGTPDSLAALADRLDTLATFDHRSIEGALRALAEERNLPASTLIHPTRLALSGKVVGPGLFELMELLGKETVVRRLRSAPRGR
ncbi:MAG: hypothetical protein WD295_06135 [Bacteroidota bacterium]